MKVSIVIPNYNTWDLVLRNINACLLHDDKLIDELIVVDDCSPRPNPYRFDQRVKIIRNEENLHYTRTVNKGLKAATGEIIILLDSDAYPTHPFVKTLIDTYQENELLGCLGFKTVDDNGNDTGNFMYEPSYWSLLSGQQAHFHLKKLDWRKKKFIMPFSCAISFRKQCLEDMCYLDESFDILDADNDLSWKIHLSKWKLIYFPSIEIFHVGGQSIARNYQRVVKFYNARWQLLQKYNRLPFKGMIKNLILSRFWLEKIFLQAKQRLRNDQAELIVEKIEGRKKIIEALAKQLA